MKTLLTTSLIMLVLACSNISFGAINPEYKEAMQRGYQLSGDSVVFPDGTACLLHDFNDGKCGQKWMTDDYCVPEGAYVWDEDRCCDGLVPFLKEGHDGQTKCMPKDKASKEDDDSFFDFFNVSFWLGIIIVLGGFAIFAFNVGRKQRNDTVDHHKETE